MQVRQTKIDTLLPYINNARTHSDQQIDQISSSIKEFGFNNPILIDQDHTIIAGHGRLLAARKLGLTEVPTIQLSHLTKAQKKAYIIADNRLALNAGWSPELLKLEFESLIDDDFNLDLLGFDKDEIDSYLNPEILNEGQSDADEIPEVHKDAVTKPGDIWLMGKHRLMCGNSTMLNHVAQVMQEKRADATITDPPYSVDYEKSHEERGGNKAVHSPYQEADIDPTDLLNGFISILPSDVLIFSYALQKHFFAVADTLKKNDFDFRKELVWVKDTFSFWIGAKHQQKHEPILVCVKNGQPLNADVPANQSTVFEFPRPKKHELHPTAKPIELWELLVKYHIPPNGLVYEPFGGSGTTFIAAEKLGRICYGIELAPEYCDVIVKRWQQYTGRKAVLQLSNQSFDEIANGS